jgi:hypothetical protein
VSTPTLVLCGACWFAASLKFSAIAIAGAMQDFSAAYA